MHDLTMDSQNLLLPKLHVEYVHPEIQSGPSAQQVIAIDLATFVIGRATASHLMILDDQISRQHIRLVNQAERYWIDDLGSSNGTYLNDRWLEPNQSQPLRHGDKINLANRIVFQFEDPFVTYKGAQTTAILSSGLQISLEQQQVYMRYQKLEPPLTMKEFRCLSLLFSNQDRIVVRDEIANYVWPEYNERRDAVSEAMIDTLISRVRRRLKELGDQHEYIQVIRARGFRFKQHM